MRLSRYGIRLSAERSWNHRVFIEPTANAIEGSDTKRERKEPDHAPSN